MADFSFHIVIFIFGLMTGSFLNCLVYRLEKRENFLKNRSYCPYCKHNLSWPDLIPVLSFFILKRKCRYCQKSISWQYPLVELLTGLVFVLIFYHWSLVFGHWDFLPLFYYLIISSFLIVIFVYDLKHSLIPDSIIYPAIATAFFYQLFRILNLEFVSGFGFRISDFQSLINTFLSAISASVFFLVIVLVSKGKWMGTGDISLAFLMGLILGWPNTAVALFLAFFIGAIIGMGLIIRGRKTLKSEIPFGPFLITGAFLALFFGEKIINWYLNFYIL